MVETGTCWPEQEAVDAWLKRHNIIVPHFVAMELKDAVTRPRRLVQQHRDELEQELNTPEIIDFVKAVRLESAHQRQRWGSDHDTGKTPEDWFWLLGYLSGKACRAFAAENVCLELADQIEDTQARERLLVTAREQHEKGIHHIITTAAACANWHLYVCGTDTRMRPGTDLANSP